MQSSRAQLVRTQETSLDPTGVILSLLEELSSDEFRQIIDQSGLSVDWQLSKAEGFSHRTRKRAYIPKVQAALGFLMSEEDRLHSLATIATEILNRREDHGQRMTTNLQAIGWQLTPDHQPSEDDQHKESGPPTTAAPHDRNLPTELKAILDEAIAVALSTWRDDLRSALTRCAERAVSSGLQGSGLFIHAKAKVYYDNLQILADRVWSEMKRILQEVHFQFYEGCVQDLQSYLQVIVEALYAEHLQGVYGGLASIDYVPKPTIEKHFDQILRHLFSEIRIYGAKLEAERMNTLHLHPVTENTPGEAALTGTRLPQDIIESSVRFQADHPDPRRACFLMMRFGTTKAHSQIAETIKSVLISFGIQGLRADDKQYNDDLFGNIRTYLHGCGFGVGVFERLEEDDFNPNVSLEVGYLLALGKPVLLLKDKTLEHLHTDLVGKLYRVFDPQDIAATIPHELKKWLKDKELTTADRSTVAKAVVFARAENEP